MSRIYWDTMIHAYWFEDHSQYGDLVQEIRSMMLRHRDTLCGSQFLLGELLVGPVKLNDWGAVSAIEEFFYSSKMNLLPYSKEAVRTFASLRAAHGVKALDALHLSIAAHSAVDIFLTNDSRLQRLAIPGLPLIASLETSLF